MLFGDADRVVFDKLSIEPEFATRVLAVDRQVNTLVLQAGRPLLLIEQHGKRLTALPSARQEDFVKAVHLLPGILTDGVALADAGWEVITVSKGTVSTLSRIHTRHDRAERLSGDGVTRTAAFVAAMAAERLAAAGEEEG